MLEELAVLVCGALEVVERMAVGPSTVVAFTELVGMELAPVPTGEYGREVELCECSSSSQSQGPVP